MSEEIQIVEIATEPIELFKLIKSENLVGSGGEAKFVVGEGMVMLNGEVETRKRKKVFSGDLVQFAEFKLKVQLKQA
jgi:ribosome-associated protein